MQEHLRHLTARDHEILEFLVRYRVGTVKLLQEACFESDTTCENVSRVLKRLSRRGLIDCVTSPGAFSYCTPTRRAVEVIADDPRTPRPLTEQTLPVALAVASSCVERGTDRLTAKEFAELYPELWRPGMRASSYVLVETDGKLRLELVIVDRGGAAHRIKSRVRRVIAQRKGLPKFHALMKAGRFQIAVLTGTGEQAEKIRRRVARQPFAPVEVTTHVIPELAELLMRKR